MSEKRKVLKAAGIVGMLTLLSRVTGLLRTMVIAAMFGASRVSDIFWVSFEIANLTRRVLGEGALSSFMVPVFAKRRTDADADAGWRLFNNITNVMTLITVVLTVVGVIFSREVYLVFGGLGQVFGEGAGAAIEADVELGTALTRIMFPFVIGLTVASVMMGACHTLRAFVAPSLGSVMLNIAMIVAGGAALKLGIEDAAAARWLAWSVLAGAFLRVLNMAPTLWRGGWRWRPEINLRDPELWTLLRMMGLALLGMGVAQANIIVSNFFAMMIDAGVRSHLFYAQMLIQFPMALSATAVATAMLPQLTQFLLEGRHRELHDLMGFSKRVESVLIVPAMVGLVMLGGPILSLMYERGEFGSADVRGTYLALVFYAPGLLALSWARLIMPLYYARRDMITPLKAAGVSAAVNIALNFAFVYGTSLDQGGLALANSIAAFAQYGVLMWFLRGDLHVEGAPPVRMLETLGKTTLAALGSCGLGWLAWWRLDRALEIDTTVERAAVVLPIIALVAVVYFILVRLLHTPDSKRGLELVMAKLRR